MSWKNSKAVQEVKDILCRRDGMTEEEAFDLIEEAREALEETMQDGGAPEEICYDFFGLEPDYIWALF